MAEPDVPEVMTKRRGQSGGPVDPSTIPTTRRKTLTPLEKRMCELHLREPEQTQAYRLAREELGMPPHTHPDTYKVRATRIMHRPLVMAYWNQCVANYALTFPGGKLPDHIRYHAGGKRKIPNPEWLLYKANLYFDSARNKPYGYDRFCEWLGVSGSTLDKYGSGQMGEEFIDVVDWIQTRCRAYYEKLGSENPKYANFTDYMLSRRKSPRVQQVEAKVAGFILEVGRREDGQ